MMLKKEEIIKAAVSITGNEKTATELAEILNELQQAQFKDAQCNHSALMYLLTEQNALLGRLMQELVAVGVLQTKNLEFITNIYGEDEVLGPIYNDLYKRYLWYFKTVQKALEAKDENNVQDPE